jgi:ribonuclease BN (tRNA processing enzyme)
VPVPSLTVTVLGSSAMYATPKRAASGYLVELGAKRIWMDAGAGTWQNLLERMAYSEIDGIVLTHEHPDHTSDVFQCYHARRFGGPQAMPPIPLWAPQDTLDRLVCYVSGMPDSFELHPIAAGDDIELEGARWSFYGMEHPVETVGVRIESGPDVFAYTGDTGPEGDLAGLAEGATLMICEATFQNGDGPWSGHMSASEAASSAAALGVSHLVLSHLPPGRDLEVSIAEAKGVAGDLEVELAQDGLRLEMPG